jgi:hypothetical protein
MTTALDRLKLAYRFAGRESGLADVAGTAARRGFLPDMRTVLTLLLTAPLFVQTTLAQSSQQEFFDLLGGLDRLKLTYRYAGRDSGLADVAGTAAPSEIFASHENRTHSASHRALDCASRAYPITGD